MRLLSSIAALTRPWEAAVVTPADHWLFFSQYCEKCHNTTDWAGSLAMDSLDLTHTDQDPEIWEKAITKLRGRILLPSTRILVS